MRLLCITLSFLAWTALARAEAPRTLTVWHAYTGAEERGLARATDAFRTEHPDLSVELLSLPFGAYAAKLEAAIPAGRGPDLFIDAHERLPVYLERKLIDPFAASDAGDAPAQLDVLRDHGALYGLPLSVKAAVLYVNTRLVPDVTTLRSFDDVAALRSRLPSDTYPLVLEGENPYYFAAFLHAHGGTLLTADGRYGLIGPSAQHTLEQLRAWTRALVLPREPGPEVVKRLFTAGRAATMVGGPWLAPELPPDLAWRAIPLPPLSIGARPLSPFVTLEAVYLAHHPDPRTDHELARELARFLATGPGALVRARVGGQVIAAASVTGDAAPSNEAPLLDVFATAARAGTPMSIHPHMRRVWEPAQRAAQKALRGDGDIEAALREGAGRFDEAIRPLPAPRSPTRYVLLLGFVLLLAVAALVRRVSDPAFRRDVRASLPAYAYVTHAFVAVLLLVVAPLLLGALASFFAGRGRELYFVGLANYADILAARGGELLASGSFWFVLAVTCLWTLSNLVLHVALGLALALVLVRVQGRLSRVYRVLLIIPWAVPSYVTALAWKGMFHRQFGAINAILSALGAEPVSWFAHFSTAFSANLLTNTWLGFPFMMVVTLGALTSIPKELYEAAAVDGATALERLRWVTLPMIRPVLAPAIAMGAVWTFNMFNVIFLVSGGEPDGSTEILVSEAYRWAFTRSSQVGYAAAYAVLIFGILVVSTRAMRPWLEEKRA